MTDAELLELENVACPNAGACGGQYTANTMSTVMELIGLSPMGFNGIPAMDPRKDEVAFRCGEIVMNLLAKPILPKDVLTHSAFENAVRWGLMSRNICDLVTKPRDIPHEKQVLTEEQQEDNQEPQLRINNTVPQLTLVSLRLHWLP